MNVVTINKLSARVEECMLLEKELDGLMFTCGSLSIYLKLLKKSMFVMLAV